MSQCDFRLDKNDHPSAWPASLQSAAGPREPSPGDYCLVEMPGAPAHLEAMLLGWRFSHAVIYVGDGHLVKAWFDRVREPTSITGTARFMPATFYIASLPFQDTPHTGGYRAMPAASDRHAARLAFQTVSVLIAYSVRVGTTPTTRAVTYRLRRSVRSSSLTHRQT
jgi:hypothetical protein